MKDKKYTDHMQTYYKNTCYYDRDTPVYKISVSSVVNITVNTYIVYIYHK